MAASSLYQEIVDNGQAATGARLVHFAWFDPETGVVTAGATSSLRSPLMRRALEAVRAAIPTFDPAEVRFSADLNPYLRRVYFEGEAIVGPFEEIAAGTVSRQVLQVAGTLLGLRHTLSYPLRVQERVVGSVAFHMAEEIDPARRAVCEAFARQAQLTIENVRLVEALNGRMAALRASEERFRLLAENASDIVYRICTRPLEVEYISPAVEAITGHGPDEYYRQPHLALHLLNLPHDASGDVVAAPNRAPTTLRVERKEGGTAWIEVRLVPIHDDGGELVAIEGIARDVTDRRGMEEQLLRAQRLETAGRIAGQVAHDFNNLLAPLVGYPELIKMRLPPDHPAAPLCDALLRAAEQLATINQDLLALGRRGHFNREPADLNHLVHQAWSSSASATPPDTLTVDMRLAADLLPVSASAAQLVRVILNVITNAREAMGDAGQLTISTDNVYLDSPLPGYSRIEIGEYARLRIADTGPGIPAEIRDKVFDAFFTTKKGARRGAGLGLSVVQSVVDDHKGFVDVQSEPGGTTFTLYLPISRENVHADLPTERPGGSERVLIVDDDEMQREVAQALLTTLGYRVDTAASGEEAVAWLRVHQADILVLDMIMPGGIDGAETYRQALGLHPDQRAIVVSGFAESDRVKVALSLGAGAYIRKPVTLDRLARAVRAELDRSGMGLAPQLP